MSKRTYQNNSKSIPRVIPRSTTTNEHQQRKTERRCYSRRESVLIQTIQHIL